MLPLRVQDVDFAANQIIVRTEQHQQDLARGAGWVELPTALNRKYPNAGRERAWQRVFPATRIYVDRGTGQRRRHHLHESVLQRAVKDAVRRAGIPKRAGPQILLDSSLADLHARFVPRAQGGSGAYEANPR